MLSLTPPSLDAFRAVLGDVLAANQLTQARLRYTVTRGVVTPGEPEDPSKQTTVATATPLGSVPRTAKVVTLPWTRNERSPLAGTKSISYAENSIALAWAKAQGADEGLFTNTRNEWCEGTTSNLFLIRQGRLQTPPLSSGCLPGVTRALLLHWSQEKGIPVEELPLPMDALTQAEGILLTSSIREVQVVSHVNGIPIDPSSTSLGWHLAELFQKEIMRNPDP